MIKEQCQPNEESDDLILLFIAFDSSKLSFGYPEPTQKNIIQTLDSPPSPIRPGVFSFSSSTVYLVVHM